MELAMVMDLKAYHPLDLEIQFQIIKCPKETAINQFKRMAAYNKPTGPKSLQASWAKRHPRKITWLILHKEQILQIATIN